MIKPITHLPNSCPRFFFIAAFLDDMTEPTNNLFSNERLLSREENAVLQNCYPAGVMVYCHLVLSGQGELCHVEIFSGAKYGSWGGAQPKAFASETDVRLGTILPLESPLRCRN